MASSGATDATASLQPLSHGEGANYDNKKVLPLDPSLYEVDHDFFSALTGITDPEELKKHILKVQAEAYAVSLSSIFIFRSQIAD